MTSLTALSIASEIFPLIKTGGLADVTGALPTALKAHGIAMRTLVPGYPAVLGGIENPQQVHGFTDFFGGSARLLAARCDELELLVLDAPHLYVRPGNPYVGPDAKDWPDNALRFGALAQAGAWIGRAFCPLCAGHPARPRLADRPGAEAHPLRLQRVARRNASSPFTISLIRGSFPMSCSNSSACRRPPSTSTASETAGSVIPRGGLQLADRITTVSPSYALEI